MGRQTDLGSVQIRSDVIGAIASMAGREVGGVVGIWPGPFWVRGFRGNSGVRVETQDQEVRLWLDLIVEYGVDLPQIAMEVQDRVREMVERMTHLSAVEVNVSIHQVKPKRSESP